MDIGSYELISCW